MSNFVTNTQVFYLRFKQMALVSWKNVLGVGFGVFVVITLYGFNPIWPDNTYRSELLTSKVGRAYAQGATDA